MHHILPVHDNVSSSPRKEDENLADNQPSLIGKGGFLGYSQGPITLSQNSKNILHFERSSSVFNETVKTGIDNHVLN
ncbi:hypothetical protein LIER_39953 [Lithospermum erythrorhizon]|uniref:Uncharacterized protein n=1 Tax=Lithospermum erythrorhizon TaxID=34254 RepID=A0AAV3QQS5_LITER